MRDKKQAPAGMRYGESIFDTLYLLFDFIAGIIFLVHGREQSIFYYWALLAFALGAGDAVHLIPRVEMHLKGRNDKTEAKLGIGTFVTSLTMTAFYLILYVIWKKLFPGIEPPKTMIVILFGCAIGRMFICVLPQNKWISGGNRKMSIARNIPFAVVGIIMIYLFALSGNTNNYGLQWMSVAIFFSFLFYFPVVIWAKKKPMLGALMLPKTMMYIWMLAMGLKLLQV